MEPVVISVPMFAHPLAAMTLTFLTVFVIVRVLVRAWDLIGI